MTEARVKNEVDENALVERERKRGEAFGNSGASVGVRLPDVLEAI